MTPLASILLSRCRSCDASVFWATSERGRKMPLDATPYEGDDPRGLFVLRGDEYDPVAIAVPPAAFEDEPLYRSHFATCPDADSWRSGRTRRTEARAPGVEERQSGPTELVDSVPQGDDERLSAGAGLGDDVPAPCLSDPQTSLGVVPSPKGTPRRRATS